MSVNTPKPAILGGTPLLNALDLQWPRRTNAIDQAFACLLGTGAWGTYESQESHAFVAELKTFAKADYAILCSSGTAAVELALKGVGLQPDDEVVMSGYDFKANFSNICLLGATPVLVDLDASAQMNVAQLESLQSSRVCAILISHLHGGLVELQRLRQIADDWQVPLIIDSCQSPGTLSAGKTMSQWGDVEIWSFGGSKLLSSGRGGAVMTNSREIYERIMRYQQRGNLAYPLSEMQAALLRPQLAELNDLNHQRLQTVFELQQDFEGHHFQFLNPSTDQCKRSDQFPVFYKLGMWYPDTLKKLLSREHFVAAMRAEGIPIAAGFRSLHLSHSRRRFRTAGELRVADQADQQLLQLHHPFLLHQDAPEIWIRAIEQIVRHDKEIASLPAEVITSHLPEIPS